LATTPGVETNEDSMQTKDVGQTDWTDGTDEIEISQGSTAHACGVSPTNLEKQTTDQQVSPTTALSAPLVNPYAGRTTQEVIAECEEKYAREKDARLLRRQQNEAREMSAEMSQGSTESLPTKRELSDYDKALREGKTHEEALYAQFTKVEKPRDKEPEVTLYPKPNPLDSCSEPVYYPPEAGPTHPLPPSFYGPAPGWDSLG
jgi:hypothetical protein